MHDGTPTEPDAFRNIVSRADADDPLALFEAETRAAATAPTEAQVVAPPAAAQPDDHSLSLDQVLERLRFIPWAESVAIVDALCVELTAADADPRVPELAQIALTSAGTVVVTGSAPKGAAGPRLARILHALTGHGAVPAPLRLFVSKWVAFEAAHSIADFTKELAYFVRPEREALIRAVYQRAMSATAAAPPALAVPVETKRPAKRPASTRTRRLSRRVLMAVALVAVSLASALAWYAVSRQPDAASVANVSDVLSRGGEVASQMVSAVRQLAGLTPASPSAADSASSASTPAAAANASTSAAARRGAAGRAGAGPAALASTREPGAAGGGSPASAAKSAAASVLPSIVPNVPSVAPPPPSGVEETPDVSPVYSSADADVTPPQLQHPQLPLPLLAGTRQEMNTIELIVTEAGTVERVRLLSPPRRMADMMLLSGAKAWRFEPASRGGESVRYRLLLSWDASP